MHEVLCGVCTLLMHRIFQSPTIGQPISDRCTLSGFSGLSQCEHQEVRYYLQVFIVL